MISKINHIAIVVGDLDAALQAYHDTLGLPIGERKVMPQQEVEIAFLPTGDSLIELITPTTEDSGVAKYLAKRGEGLHHICLEVPDIEAALAEMLARGAQLINEAPVQAAEGRAFFLHPKGTHGVLIELLEPYPQADSE
ncbi:MAG: methylmalonyl-CoA epimerase [Anaerolineae bacterium]|nr:methylmalonyl-CoA epimerase [Anaerolineae bacterium]MCB9130943.1 methylmalonyl-CoA epimerase [Anaerolineales bacterium]MCB0229122.1 methylmalonyl-CoA epimerase [Anaerolineae bacterium]MCB0236463.1 methylmalonyl-CoA epimerase [Anaerolineae bacterium]MCB0239390.1 methylmalonyl-CoA epimerase [Anaerolineae bacterium]